MTRCPWAPPHIPDIRQQTHCRLGLPLKAKGWVFLLGPLLHFGWDYLGTLLGAEVHDYMVGMMPMRRCRVCHIRAHRYTRHETRSSCVCILRVSFCTGRRASPQGPAKPTCCHMLTPNGLDDAKFWLVVLICLLSQTLFIKVIGKIYPILAFTLIAMGSGRRRSHWARLSHS